MGNTTPTQRFSMGISQNTSRMSVNQNKRLFDPNRIIDEFFEEKKTPFYNILKRRFGGTERVISKNLYEPTKDRTDDEVELLFHYLQQQSKNIQRCYGYARVNDDILELICKYNTGYKQVLTFFEFPVQGDLDKEIERRFNSREPFEEETLWNLLKSLLLAEVHLEYIDCYHPDLRPLNVYLTERKDSYKLSNPFLNDLFLDFMVGHKQDYMWSAKTRKLTADGRKVIDPDVFFLKKKFARRFRKKNLIEISLVLLSAATLTPFIKFYVNPTSFNYLGIEKNFSALQHNYSQQLCWTLKFLFTIDDLKWKGIRKDILQVIDYIQQNAKVDFKIQLPANTAPPQPKNGNSLYPPAPQGRGQGRPSGSMYDGMNSQDYSRARNSKDGNVTSFYDEQRMNGGNVRASMRPQNEEEHAGNLQGTVRNGKYVPSAAGYDHKGRNSRSIF